MDNQIFRKKSMDRISSPEQLNDYLRVSNPGVWMILAAVLVLLVGLCVWGVFGHMDTRLEVCVRSDAAGAVCYVRPEDAESVEPGMPVIIGEGEYTLGEIHPEPVQLDADDGYLLHLGGFAEGDWACTAGVQGEVPEGVFPAEIVVESVSAVSFILN